MDLDMCGVQFPSRDYVYPLIQNLSEANATVKVQVAIGLFDCLTIQYNVLARTDQNTLLGLAILLFMTFSLFSLSRSVVGQLDLTKKGNTGGCNLCRLFAWSCNHGHDPDCAKSAVRTHKTDQPDRDR